MMHALGGAATEVLPVLVRQLDKLAPIRADELDKDDVQASCDDHIARFIPLGDLVGDGLRRPGGADAYHSLRVEAELERVRNAGDLQDVSVAETRVPRANRRLGDSDLGRDATKRLASVLLQRLDDALVDPVEPPRRP